MGRLDDLAKNAPVATSATTSATTAPVTSDATSQEDRQSDPARTLAILLFLVALVTFAGSLFASNRETSGLFLLGSAAAIAVTLMLAQVKLFSIASDMRRIRELQEKAERHTPRG